MNHWLDETLQHIHYGEALIVGGVEDLLHHGRKAGTEAIGLLRDGAERWHAMIREVQATVNFADILRGRTSTHST
jgi:hypothetical protein